MILTIILWILAIVSYVAAGTFVMTTLFKYGGYDARSTYGIGEGVAILIWPIWVVIVLCILLIELFHAGAINILDAIDRRKDNAHNEEK